MIFAYYLFLWMCFPFRLLSFRDLSLSPMHVDDDRGEKNVMAVIKTTGHVTFRCHDSSTLMSPF